MPWVIRCASLEGMNCSRLDQLDGRRVYSVALPDLGVGTNYAENRKHDGIDGFMPFSF